MAVRSRCANQDLPRLHLGARVRDLTDAVFGRLTCIKPVERRANGHIVYECRCECGNAAFVTCSNLRSGHSNSCGCHQRSVTGDANRRHGMRKTRMYGRWQQMIQRCTKEYAPNFQHYGGRGISVCERWRTSFESFLADMGEAPDGMWIERVNNDLGYEPGNCVWATPKQQMRNTRRTIHARRVERGGEQVSLRHLSDECGVPVETIRKRLDRGWSVQEAITR